MDFKTKLTAQFHGFMTILRCDGRQSRRLVVESMRFTRVRGRRTPIIKGEIP
jgi:hypothetical protein